MRHSFQILMKFEFSKNIISNFINPLNAELNLICHLLALLGAHHILHVSRIRVKNRPVGAELFSAEGKTARRDEVNSLKMSDLTLQLVCNAQGER